MNQENSNFFWSRMIVNTQQPMLNIIVALLQFLKELELMLLMKASMWSKCSWRLFITLFCCFDFWFISQVPYKITDSYSLEVVLLWVESTMLATFKVTTKNNSLSFYKSFYVFTISSTTLTLIRFHYDGFLDI